MSGQQLKQRLPQQNKTSSPEAGVKMSQLEKNEEERNESVGKTDDNVNANEDVGKESSIKSENGKNLEDEDFAHNERNNVQINIASKPESRDKPEGDNGNNIPDILRPSFVESVLGGGEIPDINFYQHKKTLAKGMMDLALFSANANQLRYVLECRDRHPYFYPAAILISFSLICQVAVGITLLWNSMYNVKHEMQQANRANNYTVIAIFLVTVINVFVSAFGVANPPPIK